MADRNISYRISAQDDASAVTAKIARQARKDLGDVAKASDDAASAGKRMADALSAVADEIADELQGTARAADRLAEALGPEMAAKLNDGDLDRFVLDLRAAGLTIDDIESEAEELAAALKKMDDVHVQASGRIRRGFDDIDGSVRRVGDTTDRTGSVMANFAGNAVQDIPGIAGSFGALNVAAGQFAEYAAEGGIGLGAFAKAVGPMALAVAAIQTINRETERIARTNAFNREQVDEWAQAVRDGQTALEAMIETAEESGQLELDVAGIVTDVVPALDALGVSMSQFADMTRWSDERIDEWADAMRDAGVPAVTVLGVVDAVASAKRNLEGATKAAAVQERFFSDETETSAERLDRLRQQHERNREEINRNTRAYEALRTAREAAAGNAISAERADINLRQARERLEATLKDPQATADDIRSAELDVQEAVLATGEAWRQLAEDQATASGQASTAAQQGAETQIAALQSVRDEVSPGSPLRRWLDDYIAQLQWLIDHPEIRTVLTVEQRQQQQDAGRQEAIVSGGGAGPAPTLDPGNLIPQKSASSMTINVNGLGIDEASRQIARDVAWEIN